MGAVLDCMYLIAMVTACLLLCGISHIEYLIALFSSLESLNNNKDILPYHKICVHLSIVSDVQDTVSAAYSSLVNQDNITVIIDMYWSEISSALHSAVLPYSIPILGFSQIEKFQSTIFTDPIVRRLISKVLFTMTARKKSRKKNAKIDRDDGELLFTSAPSWRSIVLALDDLSEHFGWKYVGIITGGGLLGEVRTHVIELHHTRYEDKFC